MRTTISMDDALLERLKSEARRRRRSVSQLIADAVRVSLQRPSPATTETFRLVTFRGDGPVAGVDLDRTSALLDLDDIEEKAR